MSGDLLSARQAHHEEGSQKPDPTAAMFAGSVDDYLKNKLGVGALERQTLRARYLR